MRFESSHRPGAALGPYPQRREADETWLTRTLSAVAGFTVPHRTACGGQYRSLIEDIHQQSRTLGCPDDVQLLAAVQALRPELRRQGLIRNLVVQAFALVAEALTRTLQMRPHDVQFTGGWIMLNGMLAEMQTGEGKTLTATLPACSAAMAGIPVHIVTANDYLAARDAAAMAPVYQALGLSVASVVDGMDLEDRRKAYASDVTYCTGKQLTFDYLRDSLTLGQRSSRLQLEVERVHDPKARLNRLLLRGLCFAIVDEADSVLIDEARTPLILSRQGDSSDQQQMLRDALGLAEALQSGTHFKINTSERAAELTDAGKLHLTKLTETLSGVWCGKRRREELIRQALCAVHLYQRDNHYLVRDGKVQIIDGNSGRIMADRSWERGLHQIVEAKEGCEMTLQNETLARISYQRFFRRYLRLAGMSGTLRESAGELWSVYRLRTVSVPTHRPIQRTTHPARVYQTAAEKWAAILTSIKAVHDSGRPILVGTRSVGTSEKLSLLLTEAGLTHQVLNARQDRDEADIIQCAGEPGRITVATNMAGRGTDIHLAHGVAKQGGLHVIIAERNEARRIDRQLMGRCARQGDPGSVESIASLEDELVMVYCPPSLRWLAGRRLDPGNSPHQWAALSAVVQAQRAAQQLHARARQALLRQDRALSSLLAFSGQSE